MLFYDQKSLPELNDDEDVVLVLSDPGERVVTSSSLRLRRSFGWFRARLLTGESFRRSRMN